MYSIIITALATLTIAAPSKNVATRQTNTCTLTGWYETSTDVVGQGGGQVQISYGFDLTVNANDNPALFSCTGDDNANCNPLGSETIGTNENGLDSYIDWTGMSDPELEGCSCLYNGQTYTGQTGGGVDTGIVYNSGTETCTCSFSCNPV